MIIEVRRYDKNDTRIIGTLSVDNTLTCFTLERPNVAIPAGQYPITITYSNRFGRPLPLVNNVPRRSGIRIHPGNTSSDTEGCLLVGLNRDDNDVTESRMAVAVLQPKIQAALDSGEEVNLIIGG